MTSMGLLAIVLLAVGLALLVAEVFIPSGGMILVLALVSFTISIWCAWNAWRDQVIWFWTYIAILVVLLPTVVIAAFYILPKTEFGKNLLAAPPDLEDVTPYAKEEKWLFGMVNKMGKTLTLMNPGGLVSIDGERTHSESEGMVIERGETVQVIAVKGNRLVVRLAQTESTSDAEDDKTNKPEIPSLDFDLPQS